MSQLSSLIGLSRVNKSKPKPVDELTAATLTLLPSSTDSSGIQTCESTSEKEATSNFWKLTDKKSIGNNSSFTNEISPNKPSTTSLTDTLTTTGLTSLANTIKPILKSSSSLITNHSRHKRCSSLGHTIRYIDETSGQPSLISSPLACSTCPSTPNALTNLPTSAFSAFQSRIVPSTSPSPSTSQQQSVKTCDYCHLESGEDGNQFNNCLSSNNESGKLWICQQSCNNSTIPTIGSSNFGYNCLFDQQQQQQQRNEYSSHFNPNCSQCSSTEPNVSLLPTLTSIESVSYPNSENQSHLKPPKVHHYHHHSHHNHHHHNDTVDRQSLYSIHMEKDFRYFFQHPYARLLVAYSVIACNFLIFAEDPISHSHTECGLPIVGNVISFVFTKYPPETIWKIIKILLWLTAIVVGMAIGKYAFHHVLLRKILRLKMFRDEEGTWMIMILITFICTYMFSLLYNLLLLSAHPNPHPYLITTKMGVTNASFMKAAACGTWLGDFFTAWVVTDMMLQDELYPGWAKSLRTFWTRHGHIRIVIFWAGSIGVSSLVVYLISSDRISWDNLNHNYVNTTELTRAFLASMILVMDLLVVMQDWDFPHFVCDMDIKLPGLKQASYSFKIFTIKKTLSLPETFVFHITGKWFNYGIIIVVMMLDLNMWKNQIIYYPPDFGQYTGPDSRVYTVADEAILNTGNSSLLSYAFRVSTIDPKTNRSLLEGDLVVNSRYLGHSIYVKSLAFLPCAAGFILFFTLIYQYGRFPPKTDASYGGRLKKRKTTSSWRRERRDSRHGYISWKGITTYEDDTNAFRRQIEKNSNV